MTSGLKLSLSTHIALRYMQAGRGNRFFSWISILTVCGVAIGVAAMIVVWSVINGFETELRKRFLVANAHVMAYRFPSGLTNQQGWQKQIEKDFGNVISGMSPFVHYETMSRNKSAMQATLVRGTNPKLREKVQSLAFIIEPKTALDLLQTEIENANNGMPPPEIPSVIVGKGLLSILDAKVGDTIEFVEPDKGDLSTLKTFRVVGSYDSGLKHYDNKLAIMSLTTAQRFFKMDKRVTGIEIGLNDPFESKEIAAEMDNAYDISIKEWQSFNRPLFEAMQTERVVILLITFLVAGVAGFNILTTIFVAVTQRQRDISVLKAIGAPNGLIIMTFVKQGVMIGVLGSLIGMVLALGICKILEQYQFIDLPDLYLLAKLPITYEWWVYLTVGGVSVFIAILAGILPAWIAGNVRPVQGFAGNQGLNV